MQGLRNIWKHFTARGPTASWPQWQAARCWRGNHMLRSQDSFQTDLSKCSVILSSRTSLGRLPTHRCRVSRTIPLSGAALGRGRLASLALSLPSPPHALILARRSEEGSSDGDAAAASGDTITLFFDSNHCSAEKRTHFYISNLSLSYTISLFVVSSALSALDSCTSSPSCVSRSTELQIAEGRELPKEIVMELLISL